MKHFCMLALIGLTAASVVSAQVHVKGYTRKDGTYVAPYERTKPDNSIYNNYSTAPNVNPYTGKVGTVNPSASSRPYTSPYSAPKEPSTTPCYFNCPS